MSKDPAFLFYPGDWLGGTMTFTRSHKGAYMDLLMAQHSVGHMTLHDIKIILGNDFEEMWESKLKSKFLQDSDGKFFNQKLENEVIRRNNYTSGRKGNLSKQSVHMGIHMNAHMVPHMETGNGNGIEEGISLGKESVREKPKAQHFFQNQIISQFQDAYLEARETAYVITAHGKEQGMAGKFIKIYKEQCPGLDSQQTLSGMRKYFDMCVRINNPWLYENMSLSIIVSKFNEINTILRNGNQQRNSKGGATDAELAALFARKYGVQ